MVMLLSGILYCVWIICVGCVCKGAASDGAGFVEESAKEGELDYSEGTWSEKAQNNKIGDDILFDTHVEGKEGGVRETLKEERMIKKFTKQRNGGSGEIGKVEKWGFCDEWKMWGKVGVCGGSGVEGSVVGINSSLKLNSLGLRERGGESVLRASDGSFVEVSGCVIGVERETPPFDLCGSCGLFTNISLRSSSTSSSTSTEQIFPPLFSSKAVDGEISEKCHVCVYSSHFSSFCVSSAPFFTSHFVSLSYLTFFNISTNPQKTRQLGEGLGQRVFLMIGCTFSSVWDVYDGFIVPSLNSPLSSLAASNTSFVGCYRSQNVAVSGSEGNPSKPGRQKITENMENSFSWCEWNGSKTTGTSISVSDGISSGGAICMHYKASGTLSVKFCSFNDCTAYAYGGGIMCDSINSVKIENNSFNACTAKHYYGGGIFAESISSCVRISGCEFQKCKASGSGGGLYLYNFNVSGSDCIETESGKGESACVFECFFTSCSLTNQYGGGMYCYGVPAAFKMRSIQFISCNATSYGGGLYFNPNRSIPPSNNIYFYFFFFNDCSCNASTPYGYDVYFYDGNNLFSSNNPFYKSYTTNTNEKRVCRYYKSGSWYYQHTEKKDWLNDGKLLFVGENGNDSNELCGMNETKPCQTIGHCMNKCNDVVSFGISVLGGKHVSEGTTISVGEKKISVVGRGKAVSVIGTSALSSPATTLFSISTGQLEVGHVGIDHNATRSPSPSVFVVSLGSGTLLLEDVVLNSSTSGGSVISASVFEVALKQLKTIDVEIENIKMSQPLFAEPSSAGSSSGESVLANVTIRNVNRIGGDGVVLAKSVRGGETFVVWNTTMEGFECVNGNGGGIKVELEAPSSKTRIGTSTSHSGGTTKFNKTKCSGYGGGVMLWLADNSFDFAISSVSFVGCSATSGGKDVFVNGSRLVSGTITTTKLNFSQNVSIYDELMGYDRNEGEMGIFTLNVFLDAFSGAAHVGKAVNGNGGYDWWFCGFGYFPCKTIAFASQNRFSSLKKNIALDSGFELGEVVSMAGSYEWEVYCGINKTNVNVRVPSGMTSSCLINVESASSIKNIGFQIPFSLSSATSLIGLTSSSLTLTDCSVAHSSESTSSVAFGYSIVNAQSGSLKMERFVIGGELVFGAHSAIEFSEGMASVICSGCNVSGVKRNEGDGGWMKGTVGGSGTLTIDGCNVNGCSCVGGKGGGIYVGLKGNGKAVVNGTSVIDGNKAENNGGRGGRGGGMFVLMESGGCGLTIGQNVEFSKVNGNVASYGKDVFVDCGSGVFLESKVNTSSFAFFDTNTIPSDVLKLSGSENGKESGVIPLLVYLCTMGTKGIVDGSGGNGKDHNHCGFEAFRCLTVDYCANSRLSESSKEIEVVSSSSITKEITVPSFGVIISGRITSSSEGERMGVNVSDGGSDTQDWLVGCSSSLTMRRLSFVVKGQLNPRRSAFIHSTSSTLSVTNCSVSFESGALTDGKIGYSIIDMTGGNLIVDGFVMESGVTLTMNGKSPITMTGGVKMEILNSRMSGVEVEVAGGNGGGCLNVGMGDNGNVKIEESNFSSRCSGGSGMKGGGMMISVGSGGTLRVKGVKLSGCEVPSEDVENGGRGMGGGMFVELANQMGTFSLESMAFEGCEAWKGKNLFVEAQDLSAVINSTSIGFNPVIEVNVADLNEFFGRERDKPELIVPLVVFLRTFSSPGYVSGRKQGSEFRLCGYEDYPCRTIGNVGEVQFPSSKRVIRLTNTFSFDEEAQLNEQSYEIDSSNKDVGIKIEATGTKTQEALVMNSVSSTLAGILFELGESIGDRSSFVHSTSGTLKFADCGIKMGNGVDAVSYEFVSASGGTLSISGFSMTHVKFGMNAFIVVDGNGGASIRDSLLESVETTNMKGLIEYSSSSSSLSIGNVTAQECVMGGKGLIWDDNGKKLGMRNCTIMKMSSLEGNGSVVCGEVGDGCAVEVNEVVIEGCGTLKGCGGGMAVILKGTGEMCLGKSGVVTSFEKCSAGGEESVGGYGGGVNLDLSDNCVNNFLLSTLTFKENVAAEGRDLFISCKKLNETVTKERFGFEYKYENGEGEGEGEGQAVDMKGIDRDHFAENVDLELFLVEMKGMEVCVSKEGYDTLGCGSDGHPCESMWSGISHIDKSGTEGERTVKVRDEGTIEDVYSFTDALVIDGCVNEGDETKHKPVHFEGTIKENSAFASSVISSTVSLSLLSLKLQIPSQFEPNMNTLISSSGVLQLESCMFEIRSSTDIVQYSLISTTSGSCTLKGCSLKGSSFAKSPLLLASSVLLENSNFSNIENTGSGEGGVARVTLKNDENLIINSTNASFCSLSSGNGKGGFLYLDCQNCLNERPFVFDADVTFKNNNAAIGKNVFVLGKDFNSSVTNDSFNFDYSSMINDKTLFVGSDDFHHEKDLFMFLIPYSSFEIFISSSGFDVARCGSEEEPCFTMWKGMENMKDEEGNKTIQIEGSTVIRDSFNMSNYLIKKDAKMGEENVKAKLNFEKAVGSQLEYFMVNNIHFELTNIQLQLSSGFDNSAKTIISNRADELVISGCAFHSAAGVNNGFDCVFVDAIGGSVEVNDLSMESCNVGNSIFVIHDAGITCHFVNVQVESLNESRECLLLINGTELTTKLNEEYVNIEIDNSSFSGVKRSDNGASILESKSENKICLVVNSSNITEDKAEMSEKGGAIFFTLGASGSMKTIDSNICYCSCSICSGKGGGVYLATKERGELKFTFVGMKFNSNTARVGNDIFIECFNITSQINESQFQFDLRENHYSRINAIFGRDECIYTYDINLIGFVTIHQSDTIVVSSAVGSNDRQCGTNTLPCDSIERGLIHLTSELISQILIVEESVIGEEINLKEMSLNSKSRDFCEVEVKSGIEKTKDSLVSTRETVSLVRVNFVFDSYFISSHESLISPERGILEVMNCSFSSKQSVEGENAEFANIPFHIINMKKGELQLDGCSISNLILHKSSIYLSSSLPSVIYLFEIFNSTIKTSLIDINECGQLNMEKFHSENITVEGNEESLISCLSMKTTIQFSNCTIGGVSSNTAKGKLMKLENCTDVKMDSCVFDGSSKKRNEKNLNEGEEMCRWSGSLVDVVKSFVVMKDTTIWNSPEGGITMGGGNVNIEMGLFENNNPFIEKYPSLRRNIICSDSGTLNVMSLKGGDGWKDNTSFWMLNEGCSFEGIVSERDSSFFIPILESVEAKEEENRMKLIFKGMLLVPCNLSFSVVKKKGEEKEIEKHDFDSNGFLSEREAEGSVGKDLISNCGDEIEVSVHILFGKAESPSSTRSFILKNASEAKTNGDERIVEGGKEGKSYWIIIVVVLIVILLVVLIVSIVATIRWRKAKKENKDLREIVNDNIRKDPKAFEMVTMEMSPEAQRRREEKENEENAKKRVFVKTMVHSESEECLLSESGSTEYILGKDSDEIPDWALEEVDEKEMEEEEIRKRSLSPSISSTGTETTFVQIEDVSPTTSSMSNLVDAIACSTPHEKLIVDLRDSLFMLLHGLNKTKEMAIGTLKEREQTAAEVLLLVANLALHSFDEMEVQLSSLENLSPHIVLFSEHMVICIALHSDCSSDDDSDSSSTSSSTVVTSESDDDDDDDSDSLPSSAFEDEPDNWNECLRWKAPELQMKRKMGATKESVVFSMGMMLWEILSLQIPFGEYSAEVAGWKIKEGELPSMYLVEGSSLGGIVRCCTSRDAAERMGLADLKREFVRHIPAGAMIMTISDAIIEEGGTYDDDDDDDDDDDGYEEGNMVMQRACEVEKVMKEEGKEDTGEEVDHNEK
ncbi:uncharacterized protein MONOS_8452 [Monocercomonoides exilis]|uniref:uncharacterized protein n=1 Tax=Monocercomonoides exilis TaxID=2049356 RepID=UPI003559AC4B|nr:hypothetical protein MONOS_8452 [Monocercomonoides exilis]|eukprot:MONOS_8452.1-p1 / transcript=MONOS_8452.1 / gene=MONOS_8452 / organism=Monocercomonoides_exilis_PA203 / gene_product=unspecified product / transcript_product=unspecified product / location=Mono_scaffold00319:5570-16891(+) / protein_length=3773 / sequence_SO=supercontig / SO=protein_coding / is_pseudo=false